MTEKPETEDIAADQQPEAEDRAALLEAQAAQLKEQALRALADAENTRKRAAKEREDMAKYAVSNFAKEMLAVGDNLDRATAAVPEGDQDPGFKNLLAGVQATGRQLVSVLERFGIIKMEPLGQPFDPNFHRVMVEIDDPGHPAGTVVQVMQAGYMIHDRLLREALVGVSKGGAEAPPHKVDETA
ncbi:MAG: nucleotide exchange factor GrpE [Alphaproteobacteria bacterium]|nr:nucleotide exchange factor GrpE [Alphaproteobacteria bacterium]